jgi:2-polyprenyl-6-methoxyphenol hydroxylase-like FAD-dependent oxidoreductase
MPDPAYDPLTIAVIGAGVGGLAAACFLAESGHRVTLIEAFAEPKPLGSGLLLQPIGLAALSLLGLDRPVIAQGSRISNLYGRAVGGKLALLNVRYEALAPHLFGIGTTRAALFETLFQAAQDYGVQIETDAPVVTLEGLDLNGPGVTVITRRQRFGPFDLVIDASGTNSRLRPQFGDILRDRPYPFGALWGLVDLTGTDFAADRLDQRYARARHMIGVLPVGPRADGTGLRGAFFWSLPTQDFTPWRETPLTVWRDAVRRLWPETDPLLAQITDHDQLARAAYSDVMLARPDTGRLLFIGDAAHCTSPQLGQGANLALLDALVLSRVLAEGSHTLEQALIRYRKARHRHQRFYQWASRALTPFFQSDSRPLPWLRYPLCALPCWFPLTQWIGAQVLAGVKTGIFSRIDPAGWAPDYGLSAPGQARASDFRDVGVALSFASILADGGDAGGGDSSSADGGGDGGGGGD